MADIDVFRDVCAPKFDTMNGRLDTLAKESRETHAIVTNGLVDKMKLTRNLVWVSIVLSGGFLTSQIALFNLLVRHLRP